MLFPSNRSAATRRLENFVPLASKYAGTRNFDMGAGKHNGVSQLSPYIRTRLVTEEECNRAVLQKYSARSAEKFLQEIAWRTYWKGWLEMRSEVWDHYLVTLAQQPKSSGYGVAISGKTAIECFDHWTLELLETGYLHNHARMWFASIWIFTLKLPWQLGAEFFLKHLLDADPAANTLSWRWVAGLHTPGKHYLARASNIEKFTNSRFNPAGQLNDSATALPLDQTFERKTLHLPPNPILRGRIGHLMFPEDLASPPEEIGKIASTAAFLTPALETTPLVTDFLNGAINDTLSRTNGIRLNEPFQKSLDDWIRSEKLNSVIISRPTIGPTNDFLKQRKLPPQAHTFIRSWDRLLWPHATAGFFKLKKALPKIHASLSPRRENDLFPDF